MRWIEDIVALYWFWSKKHLGSFFDLEAPISASSIIAKDGSLMSVILVHGAREGTKLDNTEELEKLKMGLSSYMKEPGHALQFFWSWNAEKSIEEARLATTSWRHGAKLVGLDIDDLIKARQNALEKVLKLEENYIVCWTRPLVLSKQAQLNHHKIKENVAANTPKTIHSLPLTKVNDSLLSIHDSFVETVLRSLDLAGVISEVSNCESALQFVRGNIYPNKTKDEWKPSFRANHHRHDEETKGDISGFLPPPLKDQIITEDAFGGDGNIVAIGDQLWAPMDLTLAPDQLRPFNELVQRTFEGDKDINWRVCFLVEGGGDNIKGFKSSLASILSWSNYQNKQFLEAAEEIQKLKEDGEAIISFRVSFAVWAPKDKKSKLLDTIEKIERSVHAWGDCQTSRTFGDSLEGVISSAAGQTIMSTAPAGDYPLGPFLTFLPLQRPTLPWSTGSFTFRSREGKALPYQQASSTQKSWFTIFLGMPGYGKSALLNTLNLAHCITGNKETPDQLPLLTHLDIGFSSKGLIDLIQDALPSHRKHEALYVSLEMSKKFSINPFDTLLGAREPIASHRQFLLNFIRAILTPAKETLAGGLSDLIVAAIDQTYILKSDDHEPTYYIPKQFSEVDEKIFTTGELLDEKTTWWEIVDILFKHGHLREAIIAQRKAVPNFNDLLRVVNSDRIGQLYADAKIGQEGLISVFKRTLIAATEKYQIIGQETKFDLGFARVVVLDLAKIIPETQSAEAIKDGEIMYMLAWFLGAQKFFRSEKEVEDLPSPYKQYHTIEIRDMHKQSKLVCVDELHRTGKRVGITSQIATCGREGRKFGVSVSVASQFSDDFPEELKKLATSIFVLGASTPSEKNKIVDQFGFSEGARRILDFELNGPTKDGAPFLALFHTEKGKFEQSLISTMSSLELWALTTNEKDVALKQALARKVGPKKARHLLATKFSDGTAQQQISLRQGQASDFSQNHGTLGDIIEKMAEELSQNA